MDTDPGNVLRKKGIGVPAGSFEGLVAAVKRLVGDDEGRREMGKRARAYAEERHSLAGCAPRYDEFFRRAADFAERRS